MLAVQVTQSPCSLVLARASVQHEQSSKALTAGSRSRPQGARVSLPGSRSGLLDIATRSWNTHQVKVFRDSGSFFPAEFADEGGWQREEKRWQREEERWVREERRWEREAARWEEERAFFRTQEALLRSELANLKEQLEAAQAILEQREEQVAEGWQEEEEKIQVLRTVVARAQEDATVKLAAIEVKRAAEQREFRTEIAALQQALQEAQLQAEANARAAEAAKVLSAKEQQAFLATAPQSTKLPLEKAPTISAREVLEAVLVQPGITKQKSAMSANNSPKTAGPEIAKSAGTAKPAPSAGTVSATLAGKAQPATSAGAKSPEVQKSKPSEDPWRTGTSKASQPTNGASAKETGYRKLRHGSEGDDVGRMQAALQAQGFNCGEEETEWQVWEDATDSAVKTWQCCNNLPEDGIMTPESLALLFNESPPPAPTKTSKASAPAPVHTKLIPESERYARTKGEAGQEGSVHRVFLLGENRWEDPSRIGKGVRSPAVAGEKCHECRGEGAVLCTECEGTGQMNVEEQFLDWAGEDPKCPYCDGTGVVRCEACEGAGLTPP